jgi:hypothetical protein
MAQALHDNMRNPDSFKLSQVFITHGGSICYEYRAQNGFGGMNVGHAAIVRGKVYMSEAPGFWVKWNKYCAGNAGFDETYNVNMYLR